MFYSATLSQQPKWLNYYLPPIVWATIIFLLSSQSVLPSFTVSTADFIFKKTAHITVYAVLYFLVHRAVAVTYPKDKQLQLLLPILITVTYAISDELHQNFVPGRYGTIRDVGYDILGISLVFLRQHRYI